MGHNEQKHNGKRSCSRNSFGKTLAKESYGKIKRFNYERATWEKYKEKVDSELGFVNSEEGEVKWYTSVCQLISSAASETIPVKKGPSGKPMVPWWNAGCSSAVRDRNKAYSHWILKVKGKARSVIKNTKKSSWQDFCIKMGCQTKKKDKCGT